jgi:hypothetical protein
MKRPVAYRGFLLRRRNIASPELRRTKNGAARGACRGRGEKSNVRLVQPLIDSGFFAAIRSATAEIFSRKSPVRPMRRSGPKLSAMAR